jgi:hypothetical protein
MKETMPSEAFCIVYTCTWYDPDSLSSIRMSPFDDTSSPVTTKKHKSILAGIAGETFVALLFLLAVTSSFLSQ